MQPSATRAGERPLVKVTLRPTIPADLSAVIGEPLPYRIRALTVEIDGKVMGVGGIGFPPNGPVVAFVQVAPKIDGQRSAHDYPFALHRAGLAAMSMIRASGLPRVVATTDAEPPGNAGVRWLKRLGFKEAPVQDIENKLIFVWEREADVE